MSQVRQIITFSIISSLLSTHYLILGDPEADSGARESRTGEKKVSTCLHVFRAQRVKCDNIITKTITLLASFFLTTESGQTSSHPLHKEKFNVPLSERDHEKIAQFYAAFNSGLRVSVTLRLAKV